MTKLVSVLALTLAAGTAMADDFVGAGFGIPDLGAGSSSVTVSGLGPITGITVTMDDLFHTFSTDLVFTLSGPGGSVTLYNRGHNGEWFNGDYTLDDAASTSFQLAPTSGGTVDPGTYSPLNPFSSLYGTDPNGTWTLTISDHAFIDSGGLASWTLSIVPTPGAAAALGLAGLASLRRRR